jgi:large-conductance mechanosensitive channel
MKRTGDLNEYLKEFREFAVKGNMIDLLLVSSLVVHLVKLSIH